ncbi:MAG: MFS transporter [Deltaproteobacteria bacterium]|nr:MFS transporter [Deltaproteobacteria bacterium]
MSNVWPLFSVVIIDLIGFGIIMPILPFYAVQFGASATTLGMILMSYAGMQFLFAPIWGRVSDRYGRKTVILATLLGSTFAQLLLGLAPTLVFVFIGRLLGGLFAANISVASAYVTDVTTEKDRAKGMGLIGAAFGIGFILGPAIGGILSTYGYHVPILFSAMLTAANLIFATVRLRKPKRHHPVNGIPRTSVLRNRTVLKFCLVYLIFTIAVSQLESVFALFMLDRFAYDAREVAYILVMMAVIMVAIQGGFMRRATHFFSEEQLFLAGVLILSLCFFGIPVMGRVSFLLIPLGVASMGRGISQPSLMSLVSKQSSPHQRGAVMGTFQSFASLGRIIGPVVAGILYDYRQGFPFYLAALLLLGVFVIQAFRSSPQRGKSGGPGDR